MREHLSEADNIGRTGDARDFYAHLDRLSEGVKQTFPQSFCKAGCSGCCHYPVGLFTITFTEWQVMRDHMENVWSEADRQDFVERFRARFRGGWLQLFTMLQNSLFLLMLAAPFLERRRIACPFLKDNNCSIYAARPYQCRTFGHFAARPWLGKQPKIYACHMQGQNLHNALQRSGPQFQLPVMNPIVIKLRKLCRGPRLSLPLWASIWVRKQSNRG
ncbi:MAG TPA: YkgJ family cysteine cluster protein [Oscillatoriaceae cyanobacterium]